MTEAGKPLTAWGAGEHRSSASLHGETVLKTAGDWSATVFELLRHLERGGFEGAPRVVGSGIAADGRLTLTFVPGTSPHPGPWSDDACFAVGALLRRAHDDAASFEAPSGTTWAPIKRSLLLRMLLRPGPTTRSTRSTLTAARDGCLPAATRCCSRPRMRGA